MTFTSIISIAVDPDGKMAKTLTKMPSVAAFPGLRVSMSASFEQDTQSDDLRLMTGMDIAHYLQSAFRFCRAQAHQSQLRNQFGLSKDGVVASGDLCFGGSQIGFEGASVHGRYLTERPAVSEEYLDTRQWSVGRP